MKFTENGYTFNAQQSKKCWIVNVTGTHNFEFKVEQQYEPRYGVDLADLNHLEKVTDDVLNLLPDIDKVKKYLGEKWMAHKY